MSQPVLKQDPTKGKRFPFKTTHVVMQNNKFLVIAHWHEEPEFIRVRGGTVLVTIDNCQFTATEHDIIFVNKGQIHSVKALSGADARIEGMIFDNLFLTQPGERTDTMYLHTLYLRGHQYNLYPRSHPLWASLSECMDAAIREYAEKEMYHETIIQSHVSRMIVSILRFYWKVNLMDPAIHKLQVERQFAILAPVLDYIEEHAVEPLYLNELCKLVNMSPYYFSRFFKKSMGVTLTEHITASRIRLAKKMLLNSDDTVVEIAGKTGFCDIQYFGKVFKRETGLSPSLYKKSYRQTSFDPHDD
ncbi:helix-turn-helix domain-containing protein [Paenibacillus ginsengarvi]|nr:AraC family transcriptional regulator [Paenibacillus ginsengarvi]